MNMTPEQRLALLMGAGAPAPLAPAPATPSAFTVPEGTFYTPAQADALSRALAPLASCYVSVLGSAFIKSVQKGVTPSQAGRFMSLVDALTKRHGTDAHVQPAYAPKLVEGAGDGTSYRLSGDTPAHMGVRLDALLLDWDTPDHAPWGEADFGAVARELADCPVLSGAVIYKTRGGLRAVLPLAKPYEVRDPRGKDWTALYESVLSRVKKPLGKAWDPACADFTRLYRLPWVMRPKSQHSKVSEAQEGSVYVPPVIKPYALSTGDSERVIAALQPNTKTTKGVSGLVAFYGVLGQLGDEIGGGRYKVPCVFAEQHSNHDPSDPIDSSCALVPVEGGHTLHCLHASCREARANGGWKRALQAAHPEEWAQYCGGASVEYVYDELDPNGFLENAATILRGCGDVYQRNGQIVSLGTTARGAVVFKAWNTATLTGELARRATWFSEGFDKEGQPKKVKARPRKEMVAQAEMAIMDRLPHVLGRSLLPVIDAGSMTPTRMTAGYCDITRTYFLPTEDLDLRAVERVCQLKPTRKQAAAAVLKIAELFGDFPWTSQEQVILAVSAVLTAALRRSIDGPAPLFLVSANSKGVGKTKLLSAVLACVYGQDPALTAPPDKPEELEKVMGALALADADYCLLDNVAGSLGSAALDGFITSSMWRVRRLGASETFDCEPRMFLGATGNNAQLRADTDRRTIICRLVTDLERPEERRGFKYRDLLGEARGRVTSTWEAVLTILRAWKYSATTAEQESVRERARAFGSFEHWAEWVQYPLMWAAEAYYEGVSCDPVTISSRELEQTRGDDKADAFTHLIEWQNEPKNKGQEWSANDLARALAKAQKDESGDYLEEFAGMFTRVTPVWVGRLLNKLRDQVSMGHVLTSRRHKERGTLYSVKPSGKPEPTPPAPPPSGDKPTEPTSKGDALPVLNEVDHWRGCPSARAHADLPSGAQYEPLARRCANLRGTLCAVERIECEYSGSDGGVTQTQASVLLDAAEAEARATKEAEARAAEAAKAQPTLALGNAAPSPVMERVAALVSLGTTQAQIASALASEGFRVPAGKRKWTAAAVGELVRACGIAKPPKAPKVRDRVQEFLTKINGSFVGYYPERHPTRHVFAANGEHAPNALPVWVDPAAQVDARVSCDTNALLSAAAGYPVTFESVMANRPKRDERDEEEGA
jgi:hypothetical protein